MKVIERIKEIRWRSIRVKVPLMFMLVSALPLLVAMLWVSNLLNERLEYLLQQKANDSAAIASNVFEQYTEDLLLKTRLIVQSPELAHRLLSDDKIALINQLSDLHQDLNLSLYGAGIEIFDQSARLLVSEPKKATQQVPDTMVYTVLKRGEYKISTFFQQGDLIVSAALPLFDPQHSTAIGVVGLSYKVSYKLAEEIRKLAGAEVIFYVKSLGHEPQILATTLDESSTDELVKQAIKGQSRLPHKPTYLLSSLKSTTRNGSYYLATAIETRDLLAVISSLLQILYFIVAGAICLALLFAWGLSQNLVGKIVYLVKAARRVERGELDQKIQLKSNDELGGLAENLDAMRLEIQQTLGQKENMIAKLTVRDRINRAMIRLSGNELLKEVLMIILDTIHAQKGSIMMLDLQSQTLVLKVVYDPQQAHEPLNVLDHISFKIGEGIAGQVAAIGEAIICNQPRQDKRFKTYRFQEMDQRIWNMVCIPLKVEEQVLGVISLDNKEGGFSEKDLYFVQDLANQVALAIQNAELYERSITDGLTGLFIRRYFEDLLDQELKRSERVHSSLSLVMFDIDHFKRFNDTYGHQVGDWVIQKVAHVAHSSIRDVDRIARYGGEEFAIIMPETNVDEAWHVAERIRQAVEDSFVYHEGHKLKITISLGCAEYPIHATDKATLIQNADTALYASKHRGRNQTTSFNADLSLLVED